MIVRVSVVLKRTVVGVVILLLHSTVQSALTCGEDTCTTGISGEQCGSEFILSAAELFTAIKFFSVFIHKMIYLTA